MREGMKRVRFRAVALVLVLVGLAASLALLTAGFWFPGFTPNQTARILIEDPKFGGRALILSHFWGDLLLDPLREVSGDFEKLDARNSFWVSEVLARNDSARSTALALELSRRDAQLPMLVGSIGLAAHGKLSKEDLEENGRLQMVLADDARLYRSDAEGRRVFVHDTAPVELALIAARHARNRESLPYILDLIRKRPAPYWVHAHAADALAALGDRRAIPVLEEAMRSPDFHALPQAFRALVSLESRQAIPLAIDRITPEMKEEDPFLVMALEDVTGQRLGFDRDRWRAWWESEGKSQL